eukprot:TRINITY_DN68218_c0_g1_i1.p1 TRINITY_DN68218_c0_g1~~TRINITY_DN68218_c0_g1_i1.p1  ORF type:complete len:322 (-),score=84.01 TRINITY_DN68218_c0_g1_i1:123-1088(-)
MAPAANSSAMETDDLDSLIADSLGGVQSALDADKRAAASSAAPASAGDGGASDGASARNARDAIRELRQGPRDVLEPAEKLQNDELFADLVKTLQDESFKKSMAEALRGNSETTGQTSGSEGGAAAPAPIGPEPAPEPGADVEEFFQGFMKSFEAEVGSDSNFEKEITSLMSSMLSNDLICQPLQQIADLLEPWLWNQKSLSAADKTRYQEQLRLYRLIISIYKSSEDPLPDAAREEVQKLLAELHSHGQPPEEIMKQITPKEAEGGGESFEDFMKSMGLDQGLGAAEQDLLKTLTENPEELTKVMKEMADGLPEDGCKQQ